MKIVKQLIIALAIMKLISPATRISAMAMDTDSDNQQAATALAKAPRDATAAQAAPMSPQEIAERARQERFRAGRVQELLIALPIIYLIDIVLDYAPQTTDQLKEVNNSLIEAIKSNDVQKVGAALHDGADVNTNQAFLKKTPLHIATKVNNSEIVKLLVGHYADINKKCLEKETPLHEAARFGSNAVKTIIGYRADINAQCTMRYTPLIEAIRYNNREAISILIRAGVNLNLIDIYGKTAWDQAKDKPDILQMMYEEREIKLAHDLSHILITTDILKRFIPDMDIIRIVDDYAASALIPKNKILKRKHTDDFADVPAHKKTVLAHKKTKYCLLNTYNSLFNQRNGVLHTMCVLL